MFAPTVVMILLALTLVAIGFRRGHGEHLLGLRAAADMVAKILPLLCAAFVVAGMTQILIPREFLARWIGEAAGLRGILIGALAGGLAPGGPYVSLPIAAGLIRSGAGVGTMVAFLTGWSLYAVGRLPMEVGILGWKLTLIRLASTLVFPPLAGLIAHFAFRQGG